jgi:putative flippase GtrA
MPEASPTPVSGLQTKQPLSLRLILRFVMAGGFNSLAHIAVFSLLTIAFSALPGGLLVAFAWAVAIPMAYVVQSTFVWNQQLSAVGLAKLTASYLPVVTLSTALASAAEAVGGSHVHQELAAVASAAVVGFFLQRFWVYRA